MTYTTTVKFHTDDCTYCDSCEYNARNILTFTDADRATVSADTPDNKRHSATVRRDEEVS